MVYKSEKDPAVLKKLLEDGRKHVATINLLADIDKDRLDSLFSYIAFQKDGS